MRHVRARGRPGGEVWKQQGRHPLDDWFGDMSDDGWSEETAPLSGLGEATRVAREPDAPVRRTRRRDAGATPPQARPDVGAKTSRSEVGRRRVVAVLVGVVAVALGIGAAVLLTRNGGEAPARSTTGSAPVTTSAAAETDPAPSTTTTAPTTTTPTTTAPRENVTSFTLPAGTKLQRGESTGDSDLAVSTDPELIADLQRALAAAGFDPGSADGTFGPQTQAAVVAFQQANGLALDGIVGPETAAALNDAIEGG